MRVIWLIFGGLLAVLLVSGWLYRPRAAPVAQLTRPFLPIVAVAERRPRPTPSPTDERADNLVRFALAQLGIPYSYAGTSPGTGFDCSGFVQYVFGHFAIPTPHSTALLIDVGQPVARGQAQPGDIVVFTGTAATSTTPGHAGIVISALGELPLRFVHASSAKRESRVKTSQVEGTDYERRFMQVRRVLGGGTTGAVAATSLPRTAAATGVAPLPPHPAQVAVVPEPPLLPPPVVPLPGRPWVRHSARTPVAAAKRHTLSPATAPHRGAAPVRRKAKVKAKARTHRTHVASAPAAPARLVTKHKHK